MAEYSRLAKVKVSSLGGATPVILPFQPDYVELINYTALTTPTSGGVPQAWWDSNMGQGYAAYLTFNATPVLTSAVASSGGISTFSGGLNQFGAPLQIASITKASPAVVTTASNHGLVSGNVVIMYGLLQSATTGMQQIAGIPFVITRTGATTFTIPFNTNQSNFTALSGSPSGAYVKQVLYPSLYYPGVSYISSLTLSSSTTVDTTSNHNLVVGQEVAFRIPSAWGTTQLNSPNSLSNAVYGFVTAVNSATEVVVNINSSSYTAFNSNQTMAAAQAGGFNFPQMIAVGDNNFASTVPTPTYGPGPNINGPAIGGAFQSNTSQGLIIGASIAGSASDVLYVRAFLHDYSNP